jgi:hypothetical protein
LLPLAFLPRFNIVDFIACSKDFNEVVGGDTNAHAKFTLRGFIVVSKTGGLVLAKTIPQFCGMSLICLLFKDLHPEATHKPAAGMVLKLFVFILTKPFVLKR